ncbi:MAG: hypothetical protein AMXMBFR84_28070 [Candidatus Hydrogenedentota bacterium]
MIEYSTNRNIDLDTFIGVLRRSTLGERRPLDDRASMAGALAGANLMATAWDGSRLVGVARSVTDFSLCCYLADLAVDQAYQRQGIGRSLVEQTRGRLGPRCLLVLLSAPAAVEYYPRLGFDQHPSAWTLPADRPLS